VSSRCELDPGARVLQLHLLYDYLAFLMSQKVPVLSYRAFGRLLKQGGFERESGTRGRVVKGLRLK
jgi:hypothetical protein